MSPIGAIPRMAGEVARTRARETGTLVVLLDTQQGGSWAGDPGDGRWVTLCDEHGSLLVHETRQAAASWMRHPAEWCEDCRSSKETVARVQLSPDVSVG